MPTRRISALPAEAVTVQLGTTHEGDLTIEIAFKHGSLEAVEVLPLKVAGQLVAEINRVVTAALAEIER
jgi:hypothetical protein